MDPTQQFALLMSPQGGMFGDQRQPQPQPPIGPRGLQFNLPPTPSAPTPAPAPTGGMFGGGKFGIGQAIVAALNGYLAGTGNPVGTANIQMMQQMMQAQRQRQQDLGDYNRKRADDNADFISHEDYKAAHNTPDIVERITALNGIKPGLGDTYAQNYAQNGGGLGPMITNPVTGQQMMPAGRAPAQVPPDEAVARLRSNPAEAQQFDEIFGPGSAARALGAGGPAGSPSPGGFSY